MKRKLMLAALALMMTSGAAQALCNDGRSMGALTCVHLTERLLVSLQGATKAQVIKAMETEGSWFDENKTLHYMSGAGSHSSVVNFIFEGDKVVRIYADVNIDLNTKSLMEFSWGNMDPNAPFVCSDLPGSYRLRCNEESVK
jgi:hypothetical protein